MFSSLRSVNGKALVEVRGNAQVDDIDIAPVENPTLVVIGVGDIKFSHKV
jgi:hypothetical protein